jgi:hypothetical protein
MPRTEMPPHVGTRPGMSSPASLSDGALSFAAGLLGGKDSR